MIATTFAGYTGPAVLGFAAATLLTLDRPAAVLWSILAALAVLLLLIQGVSETIKSVWAARTGIELEHKEKIEI